MTTTKTQTSNDLAENKSEQFKSEFTKDADAAFDEFCKKYLNSSNGFFMPPEQSQTDSKKLSRIPINNLSKPNQTRSIQQTTFEGFNNNQLFSLRHKSSTQSNRHLSLDNLITTFQDFNDTYANFKERRNRQNNLMNKSEQKIPFYSVTGNSIKRSLLDNNSEEFKTTSTVNLSEHRKSLMENAILSQDKPRAQPSNPRLSTYNYTNTISIGDFKKKNSLRNPNFVNTISQVQRPQKTDLTSQATLTSRPNTSIDYINKMNLNNIRLNEIKTQIESLNQIRSLNKPIFHVIDQNLGSRKEIKIQMPTNQAKTPSLMNDSKPTGRESLTNDKLNSYIDNAISKYFNEKKEAETFNTNQAKILRRISTLPTSKLEQNESDAKEISPYYVAKSNLVYDTVDLNNLIKKNDGLFIKVNDRLLAATGTLRRTAKLIEDNEHKRRYSLFQNSNSYLEKKLQRTSTNELKPTLNYVNKENERVLSDYLAPYIVNPSPPVDNPLNLIRSSGPLGFKVVACGMCKGGKLPIPKNNYFVDRGHFGDDAGFWSENYSGDAIGIADGATGNCFLGYDPGDFSRNLMKLCSELFIKENKTVDAKTLLLKAYDLVQDKTCYGSCTACVLTLDHLTNLMTIANVGDSGYCLFRNGKIIQRSEPQRITFECPRQLDSYPWKEKSRKMGVSYTEILGNDTICERVQVVKDDFVIVSSDGLFDNLTYQEIEEICQKSKSINDAAENLVNRCVRYYRKPDDIIVLIAKLIDNKIPCIQHKYSKQPE